MPQFRIWRRSAEFHVSPARCAPPFFRYHPKFHRTFKLQTLARRWTFLLLSLEAPRLGMFLAANPAQAWTLDVSESLRGQGRTGRRAWLSLVHAKVEAGVTELGKGGANEES